MNLIWSDFEPESEFSKMMKEAKSANGPEFWPTMRKVFDHDTNTLPFPRFRLWASAHTVPIITMNRAARFFGAAFNAAFNNDTIRDALMENWVGIPESMTPYFQVCNDFNTSAQRIQDVAHLVLGGFQPEDIQSYNSILEIGGGYGDMCSVIHDYGFKGKYTILDFPEVQRIQKYYLESNNINCNFIESFNQLEQYDLVIATWSLSEIPFEEREKIMEKIFPTKNWLVMYQEKVFGTIDNEPYFKDKFKDRNPRFLLHIDSGYDGKNTYMFIKP